MINPTIPTKKAKSMEVNNTNVLIKEKYIRYEISIIDNGNGISKEGLKYLFKDFGKLEENSE